MKIILAFHISLQGHRQNNYNNRNKYMLSIGECVTAKLCVFINEDFLKAAKPPVPLLFNIKKEMVNVVNTEQHLMLSWLKMHDDVED